jgi:DNA repair and recombination protein RAD52
MAGAFSGHLLQSYQTAPFQRPPFAPFGHPPSSSQLTTSGPMSFAPSMHGSFLGGQSFADASSASHTFYEVSEATAAKIAALQAKLDQKLGPEYISQRPGPGGGPKLTYAEGWKIINLANEVFGFNGWSSAVVNLTVDFIDFAEDSRRYTVGVTAVIRVTLRDGAFHEDVGYGMLENSKSKGQALDKVCLLAIRPVNMRSLLTTTWVG